MEPYKGTGPLDPPLRSGPPIPNPTCQNHVSSNPMESLKKKEKEKSNPMELLLGKKDLHLFTRVQSKTFSASKPPFS